jgi:hypothetical protein
MAGGREMNVDGQLVFGTAGLMTLKIQYVDTLEFRYLKLILSPRFRTYPALH